MAPARITTSRASHALEIGEAKLWVLLIGVNQYQDEQLPPLHYPAMDCQGLGVAIAQATALFPRKSITMHCAGAGSPDAIAVMADSSATLPPQPPTRQAVEASLTTLANQAQPQDTVIIYFSGHGVLDTTQQAVLCLTDTATDNLETTGLSLSTLLESLSQCAARQQLLWLDACHSGSLTLRGGKDAETVLPNPTPQLIDVLRQRARQSQGFYALLSCDHEQRSWEFPELGHGVFSYFLMRGLLGAAANNQGIVEIDTLYKYVYYQTLRYIDTANQQLRLINQQRRSRGDTQLLSEYPLQTPKRIVEGVGELVLGIAAMPTAIAAPRQAIIIAATTPSPELLHLSQRLQQQGGFTLHYWSPGQGSESVQKSLAAVLNQTIDKSPHPDSLKVSAAPETVLIYLQGVPEQTASGETWLRLDKETRLSRSWLRQQLRRSHAQQVLILDAPNTVHLEDWVHDLQLASETSQAIIAGAASHPNQFAAALLDSMTAAEPETGLSIAGWIAQIQQHVTVTDLTLFTWLSSPRAIEVLLGQTQPRSKLEPTAVDLGLCPYRGLRAFQVTDAPYFFGREGLVQQLLTALHQQSLLAVVGASGSGKSSVVQAGVMARLQQGQQIPGSDRWWLGCFRPGEKPLTALVQALTDPGTEREQFYQQQQLEGLLHQGAEGFVHWLRSRPEPMVVLVIDQFEELFSLVTAGDRQQLLALLLGGLDHASDRFKLILTLRSDFMATVLEEPTLATLLPSAIVLVPPVLAADDYRQIILKPAEKVGLQVEPALVEGLLQDLGQGIGNLPLLEFVLEQIWQQRQAGTLQLATYQQTVGGLQGALERKAQAIYETLDAEAQACARWLFLSLTQLGDGTEDTRRRLSLESLTAPRYSATLIDLTLQAFVAAKLIVISTAADTAPLIAQPKGPEISDPANILTNIPASELQNANADAPVTIEVAHEILIRSWPTLRWWLEENRARLRSQRQIEQAAQQWHDNQQQPEYLLQGVRLEAATELYVHYTDELSRPVQHFIEACLAAQEQAQQRQRRQLQRAWVIAGVISGLAFVALALGGLAYRQRQRAIASEIAALNALSESQLQSQHPLESLLTSVQAGQQLATLNGFGIDSQAQADSRAHTLTTLYRAITQISERNRLLGHTQGVNRAVYSPDGQLIASASDDGTIRLWSHNGELLRVLEGSGDRFTDVAFHPQAAQLAAASTDGTMWLWQLDAATPPTVLVAHTDWISRLAFSPDGTSLATASRDGTVRLWRVADLATNSSENPQPWQTLAGHQGWVNAVQFSPDGQQVASGGEDRTVRLWDIATGQSLQTQSHRDRVNDLAFSLDGEFLATVSDDQTLGLWSFADDTWATRDGASSRLTSVQISPDSQLIVTGSAGGTVQLWRAGSSDRLIALQGHGATVASVAFAPTSPPEPSPQNVQRVSLLSAGSDRTIRLWTAPVPPSMPTATDPSSYPIALQPDGSIYAIGNWTGEVILQSPEQRQILTGHEGPVLAVTFSPTGDRLATGGDDAAIHLWDTNTGQLINVLEGQGDRVTSLSFSPDEEQLIAGSADHNAYIWNVATGQSQQVLADHQDDITSVAWSPQGKVVATGSNDNTIKLWQPDGQLLHTLEGHDLAIADLAFSPYGEYLASASWDQTVRIWQVANGALLHTLSNHQDSLARLAFTADGQTLIAEDRRGVTYVWNPTTGALITTFDPAAATLTPQIPTEDGVTLHPPLALKQILNTPNALESLLADGCSHLREYLNTNVTVNARDRTLCNP